MTYQLTRISTLYLLRSMCSIWKGQEYYNADSSLDIGRLRWASAGTVPYSTFIYTCAHKYIFVCT